MQQAAMAATILVAEDDVAMRELLVLALNGNGYDAIAVGNTRDALKCLESRDVDLILLDLGLGNESGVELLGAARRLPRGAKVPVILLTGRSDRETVMRIAEMGVQGYILKRQLSRDNLMARIAQQLWDREPKPPGAHAIETLEADHDSLSAPREQIRAVKCDVVKTHNASGIQLHAPSAPTDTPCAAERVATSVAHSEASSAELLRELRPIITREQMLAKVGRGVELKSFSPTVVQLISMTADPDCSLEQIARVIRRDQVITIKVLKIANSVVYNRGGSVDTVQKALLRIGVKRIRQLVLNLSVVDSFHVNHLGEHFNGALFWEHSIATGLIAAAISRFRQCDNGAIDRAFTMGLLHDVARMVLAEQLGDMYKHVLDTAARLQLPLEQVESRMLLLNHAELIARILKVWKFPAVLVDPIAMHHLSAGNIRNVAPQLVDESSTIALANRFAHALLLGNSGNNCQYPTAEFVQLLNLKASAIKFIEDRIPEQTEEMKSAMMQCSGESMCLNYRQIVLRQFRPPIRPLYLATNAAADGYRMLLERLRPVSAGRRPNVAIVHLADVCERETLFAVLRKREIDGGMDPLPVIILSPYPDLVVEPRLLAGRMHGVLRSPFTLTRLAHMVNELIPVTAD